MATAPDLRELTTREYILVVLGMSALVAGLFARFVLKDIGLAYALMWPAIGITTLGQFLYARRAGALRARHAQTGSAGTHLRTVAIFGAMCASAGFLALANTGYGSFFRSAVVMAFGVWSILYYLQRKAKR